MYCQWEFYCSLVSFSDDATPCVFICSVLSQLQEVEFKLKHQRNLGTGGAERSWRPELPEFPW